MSWQGLRGHDTLVERFRQMLRAGRLASTFLFVGPAGIGKRRFADTLARTLLCTTRDPLEMNPCNTCPSCAQALAGTHPDLLLVSRPPDKNDIPVKVFIGEKETRGKEGFCHDLSLKPFVGGRKIGIIDDADSLNDEGANALLKTLEEPPPGSVLMLLGTSTSRQLPTIRSRSQIIRFAALSPADVTEILLEQHFASDRDEAARWSTYSEGSVSQAVELADPKMWNFRREFFQQLTARSFDSAQASVLVSDFVKEANKDAAEHRARLGDAAAALHAAPTEAGERRARLRHVIQFAIEYFRQLLRNFSGAGSPDDAELQSFVVAGQSTFLGDEEQVAACLDRCLDALADVDRNANQQTLIECWLDEVGLLKAGRPLPLSL